MRAAGDHLPQLLTWRERSAPRSSSHVVDRIRASVARERWFSACVAIIGVHLAVVGLFAAARVPVRVVLLLAAVLGPPALVLAFATHGRVVRVLLAGIAGLGAMTAGLATSVPRLALTGTDAAGIVGVAASLAGLALVALAYRIALRGRRLTVKVGLGVVASLIIAQWLIAPALNVGLITHAPRATAAPAASLGLTGARDVSFRAADGVRLAGWYVPGRNRAAVILLHGSHGSRADTLPYLRRLVDAGYAVLAFDARGHGQSAGRTNALGWRGAQDVAGAVGFLNRQSGVDRHRIAALGISMGAEEALRAAANGVPVAAIVADGAGASTLGDAQISSHGLAPVFTSVTWITMRGTELAGGDTEPAPLKDVVGRIHRPVLLIASNASGERVVDQTYRDRIGARATLWYLADVGHNSGLRAHPREYAARVIAFLRAALRER